MAITVKHKFVSAIPDAGDPTIVQPSNWNDDHTIVGLGTIATQDASAVSITGGTVSGTTLTSDTVSNNLAFTPTTAPSYVEGEIWYDSTQKALTYYNDVTNNAVHIGQEVQLKVINNTGSSIANGTPVYVTGTSSGQSYPNIALAKADTSATSAVLGLTNGTIASGATGYVCTAGLLTPCSTGSFTVGQVLYLSPYSAGQLMNTIPPTGYAVQVGVVAYANSPNGSIYVKQTTPLAVSAATLVGTVAVANGGTGQSSYTDGQLLIGNSTGNTLTKATLTAGTGVSITNGSGAITVTNSAPDQTVAIASGTGISVTGTYPSFTVTNTSPSSGGTVTSVGLSAPSIFTVTNSPVTSSGTLALTYSGTALPIANGGTNSTSTPTSGGAVYGTGTAYAITAAGTAGQVLTSNGSSAPTWSTSAGVTQSDVGTAPNQIPLNQYLGTMAYQDENSVKINGGTATLSTLATNASTTGSSNIGAISYGTLSYSDTNILASYQSSVAGYNQVVLQNTSNNAAASTNFNISNDAGTATTNFGEFGINSSTFTGTGSFNAAGATYLASASTDLAIGTYGANAIHFVTNSGATDAGSISSAGRWAINNATTNTTSTALLHLGAGTATASTAPLKLTSGTNLTTAEAGAFEYDGSSFYSSIAASTRGVLPTEQMVVLNSTYTLTSQTAAQKLFNATTNGAVTLPIGTYQFECLFSLTSMSTTSGSFGFAMVAGTAVVGSQGWWSVAEKGGATFAAANSTQSTYSTAANTLLTTASTQTLGWAFIRGIIKITTAGTVTPSVSLGVAAAAVVGINSYFKISPITGASAANITVGNWS
jgi:hypothetical protein